jgi:hypothetical protein
VLAAQRQQHVGKQQQYDSDLQVCVPVLLCLYCCACTACALLVVVVVVLQTC